jgi:hypothetical protein
MQLLLAVKVMVLVVVKSPALTYSSQYCLLKRFLKFWASQSCFLEPARISDCFVFLKAVPKSSVNLKLYPGLPILYLGRD